MTLLRLSPITTRHRNRRHNPISNPNSNSNPNAMAQYIPVVNKFVGNIKDRNDPDKAILESYDVLQFISDVDARIASKKLTTDNDKIKEAHLLISSEKGDAKTLVLSPEFAGKTYEQFKELCILNWQRETYKDPYHNLVNYRNLRVGNGTPTELLSSLSHYGKRIRDDIIANENIPKFTNEDGDRTNLVEIQHVIDYLSMGILYENSSDEFRRAFKEYAINPQEGLIKTYSNVRSVAAKRQIKIENETVLYFKNKEKKNVEAQKGKGVGQNSGQPSNKGKPNFGQQQHQQQPYQQQRSQSSYQNQNFNNSQGSQNYQRGQNNYRGRGRGRGHGRGYYNYQNQNQTQSQGQNVVVCYKCNKPGHKADVCRSCHYCHHHGHWIADCPVKNKDENSGRNNSNDGIQQGQGQ